MSVHTITIHDAVREIAAAGHGNKAAVKNKWAGYMGVSVRTLEKRIKQAIGRQRQRRSDAGICRKDGLQEYVEEVWEYRAKTILAGAEHRMLAMEDAIAFAERDGVHLKYGFAEGELTPGTANRIAKSIGMTTKKKHTRMDCSKYGRWYMFDGSGSENCYIAEGIDGGDWLMGFRASEEKKKINLRERDGEIINKKDDYRKLYYYATVDMHSRFAVVVPFVTKSGENQTEAAVALERAFRVMGMPENIYTDNGPITYEAGRMMFDLLGVNLVTHEPGNSQAKGMVERVWRTLWQRFEHTFLIDKKREIKYSEFCEMLSRYMERYNGKLSPGFYAKGRTRTQIMRAGAAEHEKWLPDNVRLTDLMTKTFERVIDGAGRIKEGNTFYRVPCADILLHTKVLCRKALDGGVDVQDPDDGRWMPTVEWKPREMGEEYEGRKHGPADEAAKRAQARSRISRFLYEDGGIDAFENVVSLAEASAEREAGMKAEEGFFTIEAAMDYLAYMLGCENDRKMKEEVPPAKYERMLLYVERHLESRDIIEDFANKLLNA